MMHLFRMLMIQIMLSVAIILVAMLIFATVVFAHPEGPHKWLSYKFHPTRKINCCNPDGDCIRLRPEERPILVGEQWVVHFRNGKTYTYDIGEITMGEDEHWWLCFSYNRPDGPEGATGRLDMDRDRCLITPAAG